MHKDLWYFIIKQGYVPDFYVFYQALATIWRNAWYNYPMNSKYFPVVLAVFVAGIIFSVFVYFDSHSAKVTKISPVVSASNQLLGSTTKTANTLEKVDVPSSPTKALNSLKSLISKKSGTYGFYIKDLTSGEIYAYNENKNMYAASLYKVPVAIATFREIEKGNISLDQVVEYKKEDISTGSGKLQESALGTNYTIDELLNYLLKQSDNVAQNMIIRIISRNSVANAFPDAVKSTQFPITINSSPAVTAKILENLYFNRYLQPDHTALVIEKMTGTSFDDRIHNGLLENVVFAHKIGNWQTRGAWHDCGLATLNKTIVVCLMSENTTYEDFLEVAQYTGLLVSTLFE